MNRRSFLSALAAIPGLGWIRPAEDDDFDFIDPTPPTWPPEPFYQSISDEAYGPLLVSDETPTFGWTVDKIELAPVNGCRRFAPGAAHFWIDDREVSEDEFNACYRQYVR